MWTPVPSSDLPFTSTTAAESYGINDQGIGKPVLHIEGQRALDLFQLAN